MPLPYWIYAGIWLVLILVAVVSMAESLRAGRRGAPKWFVMAIVLGFCVVCGWALWATVEEGMELGP